MQISPPAIEVLIKAFEGCKLEAYRCPRGICTIGYGHTTAAGAPAVQMGMKITQQQADDILSRDLHQFEDAVTRLVHQPLTQHQFDVLVDFTYNAGVSAFSGSTLLKKINTAKFDDVPAELMKWVHVNGKVTPGLVRRRNAEVAWWNEKKQVQDDARSTPDAVVERTMATSKQGNAALLTAGIGGLGAAKEVVQQAQDAADTANQLVGLLSNTNFLIMSAVVGLAAAIWYWRKRHMEKYGV